MKNSNEVRATVVEYDCDRNIEMVDIHDYEDCLSAITGGGSYSEKDKLEDYYLRTDDGRIVVLNHDTKTTTVE